MLRPIRTNKKSREGTGELEPQAQRATNEEALRGTGYAAIKGSLTPSFESAEDSETIGFDQLRIDTHKGMKQELADRLSVNPTPTAAERNLGTYIENLEPQVRDATLVMRAKGYNTSASGFYGSDDDWRVLGIDNPSRTYHSSNRRAQFMDFREPFTLTAEVSEQLDQLGVETPTYPGLEGMVVRIGFEPEVSDLAAIQAKWDTIASILPDNGIPATADAGNGVAPSQG